jgi:hypothetical protein
MDYGLEDLQPPSRARMEELGAFFRIRGIPTTLGGPP